MRDTVESRANIACGEFAWGRGELSEAQKSSKQSSRLPAMAGAARDRVYPWRRRAATAAVGVLAVGMGYGVVFGHNGVTMFLHKREEARSLQQQMQQLQRENEALQSHDDRLRNDPDAIEHEAREELHYTRSGEVIYTLPTPPAATNSTQPPATP
jgi:cell division protein FtsB